MWRRVPQCRFVPIDLVNGKAGQEGNWSLDSNLLPSGLSRSMTYSGRRRMAWEAGGFVLGIGVFVFLATKAIDAWEDVK